VGSFNSLQLAARRPPALRAIVTLMSTDDRYADDVHYKGGCVMGTDLLHWSSCMLHWQCQPPNEAAVGAGWREQWLRRLEANAPWVHTWLAHQRRDAYWKHGSVCEDYGAIEIPVYAVGGWADGYTNSVLRLLDGLDGPRKGLIGSWGHAFPHVAAPGPAIGFLAETLRWWDHWLKGADTGIMDEPMLRVWMQDWGEPTGEVRDKPGRWIAEDEWPAARLRPLRWRLAADGTLTPAADGTPARDAGADAALIIRGSQLCGADAGAWCAEGQPSDRAPDQRAAEGQSLCFTSAPLSGAVEILGRAIVTLRLAADRPLALVAVRLDDVSPDGVSELVAQQVLNLAHRGSHEDPEPLEPGREYTVGVELDAIAHAFPPGHRLRVAISPTYWPLAWPSPEPVTLSIVAGLSTLDLPVRRPRAADADLPPFAAPETPPGLGETTVGGEPGSRSYVHDLADDSLTWDYHYVVGGNVVLPNGWEDEEWNRVSYFIREGDPLSAAVRVRIESVHRRGPQGRFHITSEGQMTCDTTTFFVEDAVEVCEGEDGDERRVFSRTWRHEVRRDLA